MAPKKTVATINKNLSFDNRKELSFGLIFDQVNYTAAATPELLALHQLQEILIKKMIAKLKPTIIQKTLKSFGCVLDTIWCIEDTICKL